MDPKKYIERLEKEKAIKTLQRISAKSIMPLIQFVPKNEATFSCPKSALDDFMLFLKKEHIHIIGSEEAGDSRGEPYYHIEISDVDLPESKELISKFKASLSSKPS